MPGYFARRIVQSVLVLLGVATVVFGLMHLSGDPVRLLAPIDTTSEELATLRAAYGLDRPLVVQYWDFVTSAVRGDFGTSLRSRQDALQLVFERLPATLYLSLAALGIALLTAIPLGVVAALNHNTWRDRLVMGIALIGQSMPVFWLGILLIMVFAVWLNLLPATGTRDGWRSFILPAVTLGLYSMARTARFLRTELLDTLGQDYIRTARAKGARPARVIWLHAFRNALIPVVTLIGLDLAALLAGSVITETIFAWPGVGRLAINAIYNRDFPVLQASVMVVSTIYVVVNLIVDLLYGVLDPRIEVAG